MSLLDFLKSKKEKEKAKEKKVAKVSVAEKPLKIAEINAESRGNGKKNFSYSIIREPHISEKATDLGQLNKYTFKVYANANKLEIKKSVEGIYGVNVLGVNMITIPHKKRRLGRTEGFKKGFIKAVVTIKEGQKIELF